MTHRPRMLPGLAAPNVPGLVELEFPESPPVALNAGALLRSLSSAAVPIPAGGTVDFGAVPIGVGETWQFFFLLQITRANVDASGFKFGVYYSGTGFVAASAFTLDCVSTASALQQTTSNGLNTLTGGSFLNQNINGLVRLARLFAYGIGAKQAQTVSARIVEAGGVNAAVLAAGSGYYAIRVS